MKRLLLILAAICILAPQASATFTLKQHPNRNNCGSGISTCALTLTQATTAGSLLVAVGLQFNNNTTISSITNEATWVHCSSCSATQASSGTTDSWWSLSATGGVSSITFNFTATTQPIIEMVEFAFTAGPVAIDQQGNRVQSTNTTSAAGVSLSTFTGSNDVVVQFMTTSGSGGTAISGGFTTDLPAGDGIAWLMNTVSNTAPNWTQGSGADALGALAFKETGTTTGCSSSISLLGVGCK